MRSGRLVWLALFAACIAAGVAFARRYRRFEVSGESMLPALEAGDWVLVDEHAYRARMPRRGHIVVAPDPREPERLLIKRIAAVDLHGDVQLAGDNWAESTDSRAFGPVPAATVIGRVRWRYWPVGRAGKVR
ncbi:MAG: nickel-type superoxide dismutase maturation protease [Dehalococcoidia bacterium]